MIRAIRGMRKAGTGSVLSFLILFSAVLPVIAILIKVDFSESEEWNHFREYLLKDAVVQTLTIVFFSLFLASIIGVGLAVLVAMFDFPFRNFFKWFFYLPLTIPPYIAAYVFAGMLGYTGVVQSTLRSLGITVTPGALDIMNIRGAVVIYAITLYPYVYAPVRSFLENHAAELIEVSRLHGYSPARIFMKVILPLIRLPLAGGLSLIMMEIIGDYGVARYFNLKTVSSAIFGSWFGSGDTGVALRLSFYLMVIVVISLIIDDITRGRKRYGMHGGRQLKPYRLKGIWKVLVLLMLSFTSLVVFFVPVGQMLHWALISYGKVNLGETGRIILDTLTYSLLASLIILVVNTVIVSTSRWLPKGISKLMTKLAQLGYSIPGAVIAIGTITLIVWLDSNLFPIYKWLDPGTRKLILSTSTAMLTYAFVVRYMAAGYNSVNSGFSKIGTRYSEATQTLGKGRLYALWKVELPVIKGSLITGFILTFIDILKELPLTLLLRPFNFNTLATRSYEYANDERIMEASVPALMIILICMAALLAFAMVNKQKGVKTHGA
jgi:iron(III) transport system permease protein